LIFSKVNILFEKYLNFSLFLYGSFPQMRGVLFLLKKFPQETEVTPKS